MPFIKFLLDPFNICWLLLLAIIGAWFFKKERLYRWLIITAGVWFLIISTPLVPTMITNSLEDQYETIYIDQLENPDAEYHILILGGGHGFDDRLPANSLLSQNALGRLNEGIRLYKQLPNSKLVLSGFSASGRTTHAEMLQEVAFLLGVDKEATILQKEAGNTFEEAKAYTENKSYEYPLILVTSAVHMPRAMKVFMRFEVDPLPSPTNYRLKGSWKKRWFGLPALNNIEDLRTGIYEYAGIFWYSIKSGG